VSSSPDAASEHADVPAEPAEAAEPLGRNRDFLAVLGGQSVSALGDAITLTAMPLLVLALTGSGALMGLVGALQLLPDLVFGLFAGAFADRWDRRRMMILADAGRAILTFAVPVSYWLDGPTMAVLLIVIFPSNVLRVFSDAAYGSSIPSLVGRANLGRAFSIFESSLSVPFIIGPGLAGVLVGTIGAASTLAIDALTFAISAAAVLFVRRSLRAPRAPDMPSVVADIRSGLVFIRREPTVRAVIAYWAALQLATAALIPTLAYYVTIDRGQSAALFGFLGSIWSVGYLGGSLLVVRLGNRWLGPRMLVSGAAIGAAVMTVGLTTSPVIYLAAAAVIGAFLAILLISYATLRVSATPDELQGRVGSTARAITLGLMPISMLAGGALIQATNATTTLLVMGGLAIVTTLVASLAPTFRRSPEPA
jgi:ENTS family enterobactin (siderophore) exporter